MLKTFLIGIKDVKLAFRDRAAIIFMLLAPFLLTLGMGLVTGRFSGNSSSGISDIPVVIVNLDDGELAEALVDVFYSEDLADLVEPSLGTSPDAARQMVEEDKVAAAIIIPGGFTASIIPPSEMGMIVYVGPRAIEIYANPTRPTSAGIIKSIVDEYLSYVEEGTVSGQTSIFQLMSSGRISPQNAEAAGQAMAERLQNAPNNEQLAITLNSSTADGEEIEFDVLAYLAPGMALMFLMYTVSYGGRSILAEKAQGTLPRLLVSPTNSTQILGGKVFGIYLTGVAQMLILIGATSLLFQLKWGDPLGVVLLVFAAVFGATGWGMIITALARTPAQVGSVGSATMLIFGILGGSFISLDQMPTYIQTISRITPNSWALDGFTTLALGGTLSNLSAPITALLTMGGVLFLASILLFGKKEFGAEMKKIFAIAWKDAVIRFASSSELIFFIILPLVFTFLLAGGTPSGNPTNNRVRLIVVDLANTSISDEIIAELDKSTAVYPEEMTLEDAEEEFSARRVSAMLVIPAGLDLIAIQNNTAELDFRQQPNDMDGSIAQRAIQTSIRRVSSAINAASTAVEEAGSLRAFESAEAEQDYFDKALQFAKDLQANTPERITVIEGSTPDSVEYDPRANSSAGQLVTWVFIPLFGISALFAYERQQGTLRRVLTTPTSKATYLFGTIAGQVVMALIQMSLLILFGMFALNLQWGQEPVALFVLLTSAALAAGAIGTSMGTFIKTEGQASGLSIMAGMVMALLGGCWYPLELFPATVQNIVKIFPTTWAMQGLLDLVLRGGGLGEILLESGVLLGFAVVFFTIGVVRFRYE